MEKNTLLAKLLDENGQVVAEERGNFEKVAEFEINRGRLYSYHIGKLIDNAESKFKLPRKYSIVLEVEQE